MEEKKTNLITVYCFTLQRQAFSFGKAELPKSKQALNRAFIWIKAIFI